MCGLSTLGNLLLSPPFINWTLRNFRLCWTIWKIPERSPFLKLVQTISAIGTFVVSTISDCLPDRSWTVDLLGVNKMANCTFHCDGGIGCDGCLFRSSIYWEWIVQCTDRDFWKQLKTGCAIQKTEQQVSKKHFWKCRMRQQCCFNLFMVALIPAIGEKALVSWNCAENFQ